MALSDIARNRRRLLLLVALFAGATLGLIGLIISQLVHISVAPEYRLVATFDNVTGLVEGDQVKVGGVPVGAVDTIEVVRGKARVTMIVESRVKLPVDSEAAVRWRNAIGQRVMYLFPGEDRRLMPADPGTEVTMAKPGRSVVDVGELLNDLYPLTLDRDPGWVNNLMQSFAKALDGQEGNVDELMANVETLTGSVSKRKATITQMIKDTKAVTKVIARRDRQIAQMVDNLSTLTGKFADNRRLIDSALVELTGTVVTSDKLLGKNADDLGLLVADTEQLTGGINRNVKTVKKTLNHLGPFLGRTFGPVNEGAFGKMTVSCTNLGPGPDCPLPMEFPEEDAGDRSLTSLVMGGSR